MPNNCFLEFSIPSSPQSYNLIGGAKGNIDEVLWSLNIGEAKNHMIGILTIFP